jgi:8-amino-7-oxononanoate synthase
MSHVGDDAGHPSSLVESLRQELDALQADGLYRWLRQVEGGRGPRILVDGREAILFASSDYLGLASHPRLKEAARRAIDRDGCSASAARLISGNHTLHAELEEGLASLKRTEAALVFSTGYQANLGAISALTDSQDVVFSDELNHASIIDGCRLSRARVRVFPHNDLDALEQLLKAEPAARRKVIVVDGLFSMDGDLAPLPEIVALAEQHGCVTMVDDSHGVGVLGEGGRGTAEALGVAGRIDIETGSLAKALGGFGAYVAGSRTLIDYLINRARSFIFTCAMPPAVVATVLEALTVLQEEPERRERLWDNTRYFKRGLDEAGFDTGPSRSQIIPLIIGEGGRTMQFCEELLKRGVYAQGIRYPSVPRGTERIRLTVTASHGRADLDAALDALTEAGRALHIV